MTSPEVNEVATAEADSIMTRLRAETSEHHKRAENQPFQKALVRGEISQVLYGTWIIQLLAVHTTLEAALETRLGDPRFAAVSRSQYKASLLEADLSALGAQTPRECLPETRDLCSRISQDAAASPVSLLGHHYVLEGSTNGNRFIAKRLGSIWGEASGLSYLDPYGQAQRDLWLAFRVAMDQVALTPTEEDEIVTAAGAMFDGIARISRAMPLAVR